MTDQTLQDLAEVARVVATRIREDAANIDLDVRHPRLTMENHARDLDRLAEKLNANPAEPAPVVTDEVVARALNAYCSEGLGEAPFEESMRAALEAAAPLLGTRPLLDREAVMKVLTDYRTVALRNSLNGPPGSSEVQLSEAADSVMELARPMPTREQVSEAILAAWLVRSELKVEATPVEHCRKLADAALALLDRGET